MLQQPQVRAELGRGLRHRREEIEQPRVDLSDVGLTRDRDRGGEPEAGGHPEVELTHFLVIAVEGGLRSLDSRYEESARALGANSWKVFARVTLPLLRPAIFSGAVLCWARALGEFGATITFAGNLPGRTQTIPLAVYVALETRPDGAIVLSLILLAVSLAILIGLRDRWLGAP